MFRVLIQGAGWKKGGIEKHCPFKSPKHCPELLMPISGGETPLSRLVYQFRALGAEEFYVATGWPDTFHIKGKPNVTIPVWTEKRIKQVKNLDVRVVPINSPLIVGSRYATMFQLLLSLEGQLSKGDRILVTAGDYVFNTGYLTELVEKTFWPSLLWLLPIHGMAFLDPGARQTFFNWVRGWRCKNKRTILGRQSLWKDRDHVGQLRSVLLTKQEQNRIAPQIGNANLPYGSNPLFAELSPLRSSWEAIAHIVKKDPCHG